MTAKAQTLLFFAFTKGTNSSGMEEIIMKGWKKMAGMLLAAVFAAGTVAGCGSTGSTAGSSAAAETGSTAAQESTVDTAGTAGTEDSDQVVYGLSNTWGTLMPYNSTTSYAVVVQNALFEPLIYTSSQIDYRAASSIDVEEDGYLWTVHLNENVTWSDGEPCTADDWVWTFQTVSDPDFGVYGSTSNMALIEGTSDSGIVEEGSQLGVEKLDDYTFTIRWKAPQSLDSMAVTMRQMRAMPMHALQDMPISEIGDSDFWQHPVTNGCFTVEEEPVAGEELILQARDDFYCGTPDFDTLVFRVVAESNAANALINGDIDVFYPPLSAEVNSQMEGQNGIHLETDMTTSTIYALAINNTTFNTNVRRALDMQVDKDVLAQAVGGEGAAPAGDTFLSYMDYTLPYTHERNVEEARAMLEAENFDFDNTVIRIGVGEARQNAAMIIQQNFAEAGVQCEISVGEASTIFADQQNGDLDAIIIGFQENYSPTFLQAQFAPETGRYTHTTDTTISDLCEQIDWSTDEEERLELTH